MMKLRKFVSIINSFLTTSFDPPQLMILYTQIFYIKQFLTWSFEQKWQQENVMISQFVAVHRIFTYMWVNCSVMSPRRKGCGKSSKSDVLTFSGIWSLGKCDEIHWHSTGVEVAELPTLKEMQAWWPEMCLWDEEGVGRTHEQLILIWLILLMIMMMIMMLMLMLILMMIMMMIINNNIIKVNMSKIKRTCFIQWLRRLDILFILECNFCVPDFFPVHPYHGFQLALQSGWIRCFKMWHHKATVSTPSRQPNSITKSRETFLQCLVFAKQTDNTCFSQIFS